jgi:hypothetical protein
VTNTADGVPTKLAFPKPSKKSSQTPSRKTGKQSRFVVNAKRMLLNGRRYDPLNPKAQPDGTIDDDVPWSSDTPANVDTEGKGKS